MKKIFIYICVLMFLASASFATEYHVTKGGSDGGAGSEGDPWLTIGKCGTTMIAGDTCTVHAGTYDEYVSPTNPGTSAVARVIYRANTGDTVIVRHFALKDWMDIIGFEITHDSTYTGATVGEGIRVDQADYGRVLNNYIHYTFGSGIRAYETSGTFSYNIISGNTIEYTGCVADNGVPVAGLCAGAGGIVISYENFVPGEGNEGVHHNLIENNIIRYIGSDPISAISYGYGYNIIRNNTIQYVAYDYFPDSTETVHQDGWQSFQYAPYNVFENNTVFDNWETNSHGVLIREVTAGTSDNIIIRGNVFNRIGSVGFELGGVDKSRVYNNSFIQCGKLVNNVYASVYDDEGANATLNNFNYNNIFYDNMPEGFKTTIITCSDCAGDDLTASHNVCETSGTHDSCIAATNGVQFVSYTTDDFHLASDSDARGSGTVLTTVTSATGSGTSFVVGDAGFFVGGWGVLDTTGTEINDTIRVGTNPPVAITDINYGTNTITVAASISWTQGDGVHLSKYYDGSTVDIGAYEYQAGGSTWTVTPSNGTGYSAYPSEAQTIDDGEITYFNITRTYGYAISASGCGGSLGAESGMVSRYTTGAITENCNVTVTATAHLATMASGLNNLTLGGSGTITLGN